MHLVGPINTSSAFLTQSQDIACSAEPVSSSTPEKMWSTLVAGMPGKTKKVVNIIGSNQYLHNALCPHFKGGNLGSQNSTTPDHLALITSDHLRGFSNAPGFYK